MKEVHGVQTLEAMAGGRQLKELKPSENVLEGDLDLTLLPIAPAVAQEMQRAGITTKKQIIEMGVDGLQRIKGIGPQRAEMLIEFLQSS